MNKVYFLKDFRKLEKASQKILGNFYPQNSNLVIKIHFGEPGNQAAFTAEDIKPLVLSLPSLRFTFIDTPVIYPSVRSTSRSYEIYAQKKGFAKLGQVKISNQNIKVKTKDFQAEVCQELVKAKNVLVISHVKGHPCSGFGGAIKNLGMGGVSKETKGAIHNLCKPILIKDCQGCGTCVKSCPSGAIRLYKKVSLKLTHKIKINHLACLGCSICEIVCPNHCLAPQKATFDDLLAQGAAAVINHLPPKTYYVNFLWRIVKNCDCFSHPGKEISKDIGILFSQNPVAIDKASLDLINKANEKNPFKEVHHKDPLLQVEFAQKYTKWTKNYQLVEI